MRLQIWDKGPLLHNTWACIEHMGRLKARLPLVSRSTHADESFRSFKCSGLIFDSRRT
jgi:hypothetical protein